MAKSESRQHWIFGSLVLMQVMYHALCMQVPELHGYALSLLKNDFKEMFGHELDQRQLGTTKMSEIVFSHARDMATVVITQVQRSALCKWYSVIQKQRVDNSELQF